MADSWSQARKAAAALASHSAPSVWGKSDCVTCLDDYMAAHGATLPKGGPYPDWLKPKGKLVSEERAHLLAAKRPGGKQKAWERHLRDRYKAKRVEAEGGFPVAVRGVVAVLADGDIAVAGSDCRFYARTQSGLIAAPSLEGATFWRLP